MNSDKWDARIERARALQRVYPFAAEGLLFYECVAKFQKSLYAEIGSQLGTEKKQRPSGGLRGEFDVFVLLPRFAPFLSLIEECAPPKLSQAARELRATNGNHSRDVLARFWGADPTADASLPPAEALLSWAFLQPYAEYLADFTECDATSGTPSQCPLCFSEPQVGVLRPEGDGGKRLLVCSLCANEWNYRRILCPACGEEDVKKLAVYAADAIKHVRVEACDSCRNYIKTVDLTKDGHAVPIVDELAAIPLDLWAGEHGYTKLHANLLGI